MSDKNYFQRIAARFAPAPKSAPSVRGVPRTGNASDFDEFFHFRGRGGCQPLNARRIRAMLADADEGEPSELAMLFSRILESEPVIAAHLQTRIFSVLACDWSIVAGETGSAAPEKIAEAARILRAAGIQELLRHLLSAVAFGYAGAAILWGEGGKDISGFKLFDPANFRFDLCGNPALVKADGREKPFAEYHENQFVFHTHSLHRAIPSRGGLLRPLVWLFLFKYYAMRDRARYLERFGIPFIAAKIRNEDFESEAVRTELMRSLAKLGSDGVGLLNEGAEMQLVSPSGSSSADYQTWLDYLDALCTRLILGQTATSSDGNGFSGGAVQENVRRDLVEADCRGLADTVNRDILAPLERFRWGTEGTLAFHLDFAGPGNLLEKAQIVEKLSAAGAAVDPQWIEMTFGVALRRAETPENSSNN